MMHNYTSDPSMSDNLEPRTIAHYKVAPCTHSKWHIP
jgi:hypothetical protein